MSEEGNIMFLDLETTGLPLLANNGKYYPPNQLDFYGTARMIEIGYIIYSEDGVKIKEESFLIKPDNFTIKNTENHGITNEDVEKRGKKIGDVMEHFEKDLDDISVIVSHNINFDINVLLSECHRMDNVKIIEKINGKNKLCTMKIGKETMKQKKSPKLVELYEFLFKELIKQEHRALSDAKICADCYFSMIDINRGDKKRKRIK